MNSASSNMQRPQNAKALSASQTLLWFSAGVAGMFLIVSAIFAIKFALQGGLPLMSSSRAASEPEKPGHATVTPPVRNATSTGTAPTAGSSDFESGTEGILPPEAAHLAKVTIATPSPIPAAPASPPTAAEADKAIGEQVQSWAAAWQRKAIDDYLGHYAPDFQPAGKLAHADWLAQRRQRLSRPGTLSVDIDKLQIRQSGDMASARFQQTYRSDAQALVDSKTLELVRRNGQWLILREYTGN
ncbi:MAG: nuclear transport factor 2 family protein [Zoogloea sp.]|uniref:YybH family protein n=1 Tax=Zoogloea sp. TaxID=49181 RepID=UPI002607B8D8|nr:nuclear transport factor 2 family protein [Zoogloea sp.]MDD3326312.1 nuclear transport factor 2 family protein [Zoogloea sp.]